MKYIYLASPYSHPDGDVMHERFLAACEAAAKLMQTGDCVFSPIAHSHPISAMLTEANATDHKFWMVQDMPFLVGASKVVVLKIEGWDRSKGVSFEIQAAYSLGIPVEYLVP